MSKYTVNKYRFINPDDKAKEDMMKVTGVDNTTLDKVLDVLDDVAGMFYSRGAIETIFTVEDLVKKTDNLDDAVEAILNLKKEMGIKTDGDTTENDETTS